MLSYNMINYSLQSFSDWRSPYSISLINMNDTLVLVALFIKYWTKIRNYGQNIYIRFCKGCKETRSNYAAMSLWLLLVTGRKQNFQLTINDLIKLKLEYFTLIPGILVNLLVKFQWLIFFLKGVRLNVSTISEKLSYVVYNIALYDYILFLYNIV